MTAVLLVYLTYALLRPEPLPGGLPEGRYFLYRRSG